MNVYDENQAKKTSFTTPNVLSKQVLSHNKQHYANSTSSCHGSKSFSFGETTKC